MVLPGIGTIQLQPMQAQSAFTESLVKAPGWLAVFTEDRNANAPELQLQQMATLASTSAVEAEKQLLSFTEKIQATLAAGEAFNILNVGAFQKQADALTFVTAPQLTSLFDDVKAHKVIRENANHKVLVGERERSSIEMYEALNKKRPERNVWMTVGIVFFLLAVIIIAWYFLMN